MSISGSIGRPDGLTPSVEPLAPPPDASAPDAAETAAVTAFFRTASAPAASAAEGEVAARTLPLTEAGRARPGENLAPIEAHREVYVNALGHFVTRPGQAGAPASVQELGEGLYRAASIVDDTKANLFAAMPLDVKHRMYGNIAAALARVPAGGLPPIGLDSTQAKQLRSSAATVLFELMRSVPPSGASAALHAQSFRTYMDLCFAETDKTLRQSMATSLDLVKEELSPAQRAEADRFLESVFPVRPPYDEWFANGNETVKIAFSTGPEFLEGNVRLLRGRGWTQKSAEPRVFTKTIEKDGVKTSFEIALRVNRGDMFAEMADPETHIVAYDGHADWGRNVRRALGNAPPMEGAKLALLGLCAGKGELNMIQDRYPDAHAITTWNSSYFWTGPDGVQTRSENFETLMALVDGIAGRDDYEDIAEATRRRAMLAWSHTVDNNVIFPTDLTIRRRVLDRDYDGQADHFDRFVDFSTFKVAEDSRNDWQPKDAGRPADMLAGARVHLAAMGINRNSYYNEVLKGLNPRGTVVNDGFFDPKPDEREIVKFRKDTQDGVPVLRMSVNARFAHMSEETIRALSVYEFNRHLAATEGRRWPFDLVETKLHGLILISHSLDTDSGYRDREVWESSLKALGFPPIDKNLVDRIRDADHHWYSGSKDGVEQLKRALGRDLLRQLESPDVGRPNIG